MLEENANDVIGKAKRRADNSFRKEFSNSELECLTVSKRIMASILPRGRRRKEKCFGTNLSEPVTK